MNILNFFCNYGSLKHSGKFYCVLLKSLLPCLVLPINCPDMGTFDVQGHCHSAARLSKCTNDGHLTLNYDHHQPLDSSMSNNPARRSSTVDSSWPKLAPNANTTVGVSLSTATGPAKKLSRRSSVNSDRRR